MENNVEFSKIEMWVKNTFCPIPSNACRKIYEWDVDEFDFDNVTEFKPKIGDIVEGRRIVQIIDESVEFDDGTIEEIMYLPENSISIWSVPKDKTMWYFRSLSREEGELRISLLSECGFQVYMSEDLGLVFYNKDRDIDFDTWAEVYETFRKNDLL